MDILLTVTSKADGAAQHVRRGVEERMVLGRGPDSAVPLDAPGISREHLQVETENSTVFLTDLSSNGTWLNGARMPAHRKCKVGEADLVELPGYEIRFQLARAASVAAVNGSARTEATSRAALTSADIAPRPSGASFTGLELFVFTVVLFAVALLATYLLS